MTDNQDLSFNPAFDIWHYMSYTVAKTLHFRPLEILTQWSCEEVLISFGVYMNELMSAKHSEFESLDSQIKSKIPKSDRPSEYAMKFVTFEQLEALNKPLSDEEIEAEKLEEAKMLAFMNGGGLITRE